MAVTVSALLLVLTLAGAAWLTAVRTRPLALGPVHNAQGIPGVRIAWPDGWSPYRPAALPGVHLTAVAQISDKQIRRLLMLATGPVSSKVIPPERAAVEMLQIAGQTLGLRTFRQHWMIAEGTMAGLPAFQIRCPVRYPNNDIGWLQVRAVCQRNGRPAGLLLLSPEQITPEDNRIMDAVADSIEFTQTPDVTRHSRSSGSDATPVSWEM